MTTKKHAFLILFLSLFLGTAIVNVSHAIQNDSESKTVSISDLRRLQGGISNIEREYAILTTAVRNQIAKNHQMEAEKKEVSKKRILLLKDQDKLAISESSFEEVIRTLLIQRVQLTIELAGLEARREVLLGIYEKSRNVRVKESTMTRSLLARLVTSQREQVENAKKLNASGSLSTSDMRAVEAKLLEAEIRYAQFDGSQAPGVGSELENHLSHTSLDRAEKKARLATTERLLAEYTSARPLISEIRLLNREFELREDKWLSGVSRLSDLHRELSMVALRREATQTSLDRLHQKIRNEKIKLPFDYEVPDKK